MRDQKNRNKKEESKYSQREDLKQDTRSCNFAAIDRKKRL
jgi:hypothetical protein